MQTQRKEYLGFRHIVPVANKKDWNSFFSFLFLSEAFLHRIEKQGANKCMSIQVVSCIFVVVLIQLSQH